MVLTLRRFSMAARSYEPRSAAETAPGLGHRPSSGISVSCAGIPLAPLIILLVPFIVLPFIILLADVTV